MVSALLLPTATAVASRLVVVDRTGSTNSDLVRAAAADPAGWPHLSVLATDDQVAGRGRLDRSWQAPAGTSLAASVLLRPAIAAGNFGWIPLLAGLAMTRAIRAAGADGALKWPNDVLVGGRKVCGILAELLPGPSSSAAGGQPTTGVAVVVGSGVNLAMTEAQLPVPTATSLAIEGADPDPDALLAAYLGGLRDLVALLEADPDAARAEVVTGLATIGKEVRVQLPNGGTLTGTATGLDESGRLQVDNDAGTTAVGAGDVTHVRY